MHTQARKRRGAVARLASVASCVQRHKRRPTRPGDETSRATAVRQYEMPGRGIARTIAGIGIMVAACAAGTSAQAGSPHHGFLGGPWEVLATVGHDGAALRTPLSITDESKPQKLEAVMPVMGTPFKVKLERYLPDVKWETAPVDDPNGGPVAKLSLRGEGLQQDIWLCARDREKQSISAHVGSVALRELPVPLDARFVQELADPDVTGVLLVWLSDTSTPLAYPVKPGKVVSLAGSPWKLSMLRYVPHYTIDRQTKQVTSQSDKPENPALEIRVEGNGQKYEQWLWALFASSPHMNRALPFRAKFVDLHVSSEPGRYILAVGQGTPSFLFSRQDRKRRVEPLETGKRYPFGDNRYSFGVDEVRSAARIVTAWKEGSEVLLNPAVVATLIQSTSAEQVLLELGKPYHHKTPSGTLVVLYRRVPDSPKPQS